MGYGMGRGVQGTVTEVAADHYTIKTETGDIYKVNFSANTRILKQPAQQHMQGESREPGERPTMQQPTQLKAADIKVGDPVAAIGEVDASTKSVGAMVVLLIDPERAKMMQEMRANYGKTWLMGKVTAISGVSVTLEGSLDNTLHTFTADENTTFRKRRDPITLADMQVGDTVRVDGEVKSGTFVAARVNVMGAMQQGPASVPRSSESPAQSPTAPAPTPQN
jgi:hypothetical protein